MPTTFPTALSDGIHRLEGTTHDHDELLHRIGDAQFVLLGEASHGTQEFYRERAEITKRLISEKGFTAVAVEADWPDAYRVHRYVNGRSIDTSPRQALDDFKRFPTWMWRNTEVLEFIRWLRTYNDAQQTVGKVGFYGLDLYSLHASMRAVLDYLQKTDPAAADRARSRYACFDHVGEDSQRYGYMAAFGLSPSCEEEVLAQLSDLQRHRQEYLRRDGFIAEDELFYAEQNARLVKNAERYYRTMFQGRISSWNVRDQHMADTLLALRTHLSRRLRQPKFVLWAHNSHLGDARATEMKEQGEINVGQLIRERYGREAVLIGFSTYHGTVTAASEWDGPVERKRVREALPGSYEALFHDIAENAGPNFLVQWDDPRVLDVLHEWRLERAIGVIYLPETERLSHYFYAILPEQFDALLHFDMTQAVEPLDLDQGWEDAEPPGTFPTGI
ncbi:MAG TPA: erythromycin esterase family protein [Nitrospira sp.]|nr:erythromycin esterase family protein [Nitrospira sp.]